MVLVLEDFATNEECANLVAQVNEYRRDHEVLLVERPEKELSLKYAVIDGERIAECLPRVLRVYASVTRLVMKLMRANLEPLTDRKVACNINITQPGGSYRYHYDRNAVTAILYLNQIRGGETECYPNYRLSLSDAFNSPLQQKIDRLLQNRYLRSAANQLLVRPRPGRLLIMQGNRCLHSVRPVLGHTDRINIIMSYDRPNASFAVADDLNNYLYSSKKLSTRDPNYLR
ncbi:MAG TPA: 2OG-Fe(II) oxygenase [Pyrinomonadaceae bacterium]|nr:2OG-Fe(II) oxygenase [Pyrinomonadaceae bacterium]